MKTRGMLSLALGVGIGYVLGARAGRARYDELKSTAQSLWQNPRVRKARTDASSYAREQAPLIRARAEAAAKDVADRVQTTAEDVRGRVVTTAEDVRGRVVTTAGDVRAGAEKVAQRVGEARDNALVDIGNIGELGDDDEDAPRN